MTTVFSNIDNQAAIGPGARALARHMALLRVIRAISQEPTAAPRSTRSPRSTSARTRRCLRSKSRPKAAAAAASAIAITAAPTPAPFRSARPPRRCPMETDPRKLFIRLFGQGDNAAGAQRVVQAVFASLLDMVGGEANRPAAQCWARRTRPCSRDYLESVREIERRIQKMEARDLSHVDIPDAPPAAPIAFDAAHQPDVRLVALAYQANMTRVFTFMMAAEVSGQTYNHIGVPDAFHPLSHHNNEQAKMDRLVKIQTYHTQVFAKFLDKLAKMPDGDGTMLDHSMFLYGSNMSNSNAHNHYPLPTSIWWAAGRSRATST